MKQIRGTSSPGQQLQHQSFTRSPHVVLRVWTPDSQTGSIYSPDLLPRLQSASHRWVGNKIGISQLLTHTPRTNVSEISHKVPRRRQLPWIRGPCTDVEKSPDELYMGCRDRETGNSQFDGNPPTVEAIGCRSLGLAVGHHVGICFEGFQIRFLDEDLLGS